VYRTRNKKPTNSVYSGSGSISGFKMPNPMAWHSTKGPPVVPHAGLCAECADWHSVNGASLPSVRTITLSKGALSVPMCAFFVGLYGHCTQQIDQRPTFYQFLLFHLNKQKIYHIINTYTSHISHNHHIHHKTPHILQRPQISQVSHKDHKSHMYHKIVHKTHKYSQK
jgi:hypothetical protein